MLQWMLMPYRRFFDFEGRSRRMEYWSFHLFQFLVSMIGLFLMIIGAESDKYTSSYQSVENGVSTSASYNGNLGPVSWIGLVFLIIFGLINFIPSLSLTVRRLHDRDKSGLYILLTFIPLLGLIFAVIMLINFFMEGTRGPNRYGADPKGGGVVNADVFS